MNVLLERIKNGVLDENPTFFQVIGICPVLAVTTSAINGIGMGLAATSVMIGANVAVSLVRKLIPAQVRLPCFVVIIAGFVTMLQFLLEGFLPSLYSSLGIFIPLIAVNCVIFARVESFASKNGPLVSLFDGLGMGLGITISLLIIGCIREFLGAGTLFGHMVLWEAIPRTVIMILPPGAFFTLAFLMAGLKWLRRKGAI